MKLLTQIFICLALACFAGCNSNAVNQKTEDAKLVLEASQSPNSPTGAELEAVKDVCDDAQTTEEIQSCNQKEFETSDARLNETYQKIVGIFQQNNDAAKQNVKNVENLKAAQAAWLKYRETNCLAETETYAGGAMEKYAGLICKRRLTEQRIEELNLVYLENR
jgi:uncharacterized protein YecT (DUF1311 family)